MNIMTDDGLAEPVFLEVDAGGQLFVDGERTGTHLTTKETLVLRAIMGQAHVTTFDFLLSYLYHGRDEPETKILNVFVHKVRRKLGANAGAIATVWGRGWIRNRDYVLVPESAATIDVAIRSDLVDRLILHTALPAEACVEMSIRETVARLENQ